MIFPNEDPRLWFEFCLCSDEDPMLCLRISIPDNSTPSWRLRSELFIGGGLLAQLEDSESPRRRIERFEVRLFGMDMGEEEDML